MYRLSRAHDNEGELHRSRARQARLSRLRSSLRADTFKVVEVASRRVDADLPG